jgi:FtsH-binding integral membrane protein
LDLYESERELCRGIVRVGVGCEMLTESLGDMSLRSWVAGVSLVGLCAFAFLGVAVTPESAEFAHATAWASAAVFGLTFVRRRR